MTAALGASVIAPDPTQTVYRDLALSIEWHDLRILPIPSLAPFQLIVGHKRRSDPLRAVLPLPLHTTSLRPSTLKSIFARLSELPLDTLPPPDAPLVPTMEELKIRIAQSRGQEAIPENREEEEGPINNDLDRDMIYMAITTTDSTVVYYKLSKGIKKPADIPDE